MATLETEGKIFFKQKTYDFNGNAINKIPFQVLEENVISFSSRANKFLIDGRLIIHSFIIQAFQVIEIFFYLVIFAFETSFFAFFL
jgi:hypothetical protein